MDGAVTLEQLAAQLNKIEQENARLREAIAALQARQAIGRREGEQPTTPAGAETPRSSRRRVLSTALSAVTAAVGASVVLDAHAQTALADNAGTFSSGNATVPAVTATGSNGAKGVIGSSDSNYGLYGSSNNFIGVYGVNNSDNIGVSGYSSTGYGVFGTTGSGGYGVYGYSQTGIGVYADSSTGIALYATSVYGGDVIYATSQGGGNVVHAVTYGASPSTPDRPAAMLADSNGGYGVYATSAGSGAAVKAINNGSGEAVYATSARGNAINADAARGRYRRR